MSKRTALNLTIAGGAALAAPIVFWAQSSQAVAPSAAPVAAKFEVASIKRSTGESRRPIGDSSLSVKALHMTPGPAEADSA